jgi:hypothetical protein
MPSKLLLYLSAERATAAFWRNDKLADVVSFDNDPAGRDGFGGLLVAHSSLPVYLVVDCVEEEFRSETLPHVSGRAHRDMVSRKLKQVFRNAPFSAAWQQGREADKRKDDIFLFAALTVPDLLRPWLATIQAVGNPLAGIYLLPMVTRSLLEKLHLKEHHLLVVSEGSGGLRQSYFRDGNLKISRLIPLDTPHDTSHTATYATEIGKTRLFLNGQRQITRDENLAVILLDCREGVFAKLNEQLNAEPGQTCRIITARQMSAALGVSFDSLYASPDILHLFALGLKAPPVSLAPDELTRGFRLYQTRRAIYMLSLAVLLAAVSWGGMNFYRQLAALDEISTTESTIRKNETLYLEIARQFPSAPTSAENLKNAVDMAQTLQRESRDPERLMAVVSHALDSSADIALAKLNWKHSAAQSSAVQSSSEDESAKSPRAGGSQPTSLVAAAEQGEAAYLEGEVAPFFGDYRSAIASIQAFADKLRHDKAVAEVSVMHLPLDIDPASSLSGSTLNGNASSSNARFTLKVVLRAHT